MSTSVMGMGGSKVHTRMLKRMCVTKTNPDIKNEETTEYSDMYIIDEDYWNVIELDERENSLYEKRFKIDDWVKAMNHFEERSGHPVVWEKDI